MLDEAQAHDLGTSDGTLDLAWEYDPAADSWKQIAKLPSKRTAGSAIEFGGKIYFIGGSTDITAPDGKTLTIVTKGDNYGVQYGSTQVFEKK